MKIRDKNEQLKALIRDLLMQERPVWKALARGLNRPERKGFKVSLKRIERHAKGKEILAVPGVVLGSGEVSRARDVAALRFSDSAREKLSKAGGRCLTIRQLLKENPRGKGIRIMG
jgi:large subunit ribosomal protein L18e